MSRTPRADRLRHFQQRRLDALRGRTNDAITALERGGHVSAPIARLLRHLLDFADERGGTRIGAVALGEAMLRGKRRVLDLQAIACEQGWLQCIRRGGGKHRTNWFLLKIGVWRDDPQDTHPQRHFADRLKAALAIFTAAEEDIFLAHYDRGYCSDGTPARKCWQFAPAELRQPPIEWVSV